MFQTVTNEDFSMGKGRGGRPRAAGERTESGQLSRSKGALEGRQSVDQLAQQRAQKYVVLGDIGQGVDLNSPIAIMEAKGHITAEQASAGAEIERLHDLLFGRPFPKVPGASTPGPTMSLKAQDKREKELRADYEHAWRVLGTVGGNAVVITRMVCCGREIPVWVGSSATVTVDPVTNQLIAAKAMDRRVFRAMLTQLPALRRGLQACYAAGIMSAKKGRR